MRQTRSLPFEDDRPIGTGSGVTPGNPGAARTARMSSKLTELSARPAPSGYSHTSHTSSNPVERRPQLASTLTPRRTQRPERSFLNTAASPALTDSLTQRRAHFVPCRTHSHVTRKPESRRRRRLIHRHRPRPSTPSPRHSNPTPTPTRTPQPHRRQHPHTQCDTGR